MLLIANIFYENDISIIYYGDSSHNPVIYLGNIPFYSILLFIDKYFNVINHRICVIIIVVVSFVNAITNSSGMLK